MCGTLAFELGHDQQDGRNHELGEQQKPERRRNGPGSGQDRNEDADEHQSLVVVGILRQNESARHCGQHRLREESEELGPRDHEDEEPDEGDCFESAPSPASMNVPCQDQGDEESVAYRAYQGSTMDRNPQAVRPRRNASVRRMSSRRLMERLLEVMASCVTLWGVRYGAGPP